MIRTYTVEPGVTVTPEQEICLRAIVDEAPDFFDKWEVLVRPNGDHTEAAMVGYVGDLYNAVAIDLDKLVNLPGWTASKIVQRYAPKMAYTFTPEAQARREHYRKLAESHA